MPGSGRSIESIADVVVQIFVIFVARGQAAQRGRQLSRAAHVADRVLVETFLAVLGYRKLLAFGFRFPRSVFFATWRARAAIVAFTIAIAGFAAA